MGDGTGLQDDHEGCGGAGRHSGRLKELLQRLGGQAARGAAYAAGSGAVSLLILWWQQH